MELLRRVSRFANVLAVVLIVLTLIAMPIARHTAFALEFGGEGYANTLMSGDAGNRGGWDGNVIAESAGGEKIGEGGPEAFVKNVNNISDTLGVGAVVFCLVFAGARMAGRGIYEMVFRESRSSTTFSAKEGQHSILLSMVALASERKSGRYEPDWVHKMILENAKYIALVLGIWLILAVLTQIVLFVIMNILAADESGSLSHFHLGPIDVSL